MLFSKAHQGIAIFIIVLLISACGQLKSEFSSVNCFHPDFYSGLLTDTCGNKATQGAVSDPIKTITVYKTGFSEKLVETGSIINYASLNDESTRETVQYRPPRTGYRQDMYLVHLQFQCQPDTWCYYSVWYRYDNKQRKVIPYGFGKAYLGQSHNLAGTIYFKTNLIVKESDNGFHLVPKGKAQFYFVFDDLMSDTLKMNRMVIEEKNKFGGPRSYVFKVSEHFPGDMKTINFIRQKSM